MNSPSSKYLYGRTSTFGTSVNAQRDITHYVHWDHARKGRKSIAICGDWCDEGFHANTPTCPECLKELAKTPEQVF